MEEQEKKISLPEIIIMFLIVGSAWLFTAFADIAFAIPIIGQALVLISEVVNFFVAAIIQFWLFMKGGIGFKPQITALAGNLIAIIPGLNALPAELVALAIAIIMINNPKIEQIATGALKGAITKGGVAGAVAGAAKEAIKK